MDVTVEFNLGGNAAVKADILTLRRAAIAAALLTVAACASTPIPNEKIAVAKASVQRAEQSGAPEFAPVELAAAKEKLSRAEKAAADREAQPATQLAEQANVDAQLAEATAAQQKSHKAATEFDASMQTLRQETMRSSQSPQ
jgi:lipoprotein-anchoring transpeptidase ErfK/SrfK